MTSNNCGAVYDFLQALILSTLFMIGGFMAFVMLTTYAPLGLANSLDAANRYSNWYSYSGNNWYTRGNIRTGEQKVCMITNQVVCFVIYPVSVDNETYYGVDWLNPKVGLRFASTLGECNYTQQRINTYVHLDTQWTVFIDIVHSEYRVYIDTPTKTDQIIIYPVDAHGETCYNVSLQYATSGLTHNRVAQYCRSQMANVKY